MITKTEDIEIGIDLIVDCNHKLITLRSHIEPVVIYSFLKNLWIKSDYYMRFPFPLISDVDAFNNFYFKLVHGWKINNYLVEKVYEK